MGGGSTGPAPAAPTTGSGAAAPAAGGGAAAPAAPGAESSGGGAAGVPVALEPAVPPGIGCPVGAPGVGIRTFPSACWGMSEPAAHAVKNNATATTLAVRIMSLRTDTQVLRRAPTTFLTKHRFVSLSLGVFLACPLFALSASPEKYRNTACTPGRLQPKRFSAKFRGPDPRASPATLPPLSASRVCAQEGLRASAPAAATEQHGEALAIPEQSAAARPAGGWAPAGFARRPGGSRDPPGHNTANALAAQGDA